MKGWMNIKTAGLPRWAWVAILAGGVGVGLYVRARSKTENESATEPSEELPEHPQTMGSYEGTEAGGGLQGLGIAGPTPEASVPVETPRIPEGYEEGFSGQGETIQGLANGIIEAGAANNELTEQVLHNPTKEVIREKMVGHPAQKKPYHKPPKKHKKKKTAKK